eukprot:403348931
MFTKTPQQNHGIGSTTGFAYQQVGLRKIEIISSPKISDDKNNLERRQSAKRQNNTEKQHDRKQENIMRSSMQKQEKRYEEDQSSLDIKDINIVKGNTHESFKNFILQNQGQLNNQLGMKKFQNNFDNEFTQNLQGSLKQEQPPRTAFLGLRHQNSVKSPLTQNKSLPQKTES